MALDSERIAQTDYVCGGGSRRSAAADICGSAIFKTNKQGVPYGFLRSSALMGHLRPERALPRVTTHDIISLSEIEPLDSSALQQENKEQNTKKRTLITQRSAGDTGRYQQWQRPSSPMCFVSQAPIRKVVFRPIDRALVLCSQRRGLVVKDIAEKRQLDTC
ncbi:uncharacterized protein CIMG_12216 [Coccidioides immitis RS]|uniref:Uncharacterized protein n=1 Tax=Coccidioides immitis (strain RS) TaxID=246410 RepID=A0A0D8JWS5_COCIM|nr:uncharacterized protein CIMG_12216 [Coccidioides immitis RS]KJF60728.1 hypothetical protein CIMG_12216 [Coccidioides immitis RS]